MATLTQIIEINKIKISSNRRKVNPDKVKEIADSIKLCGLLQDIIVDKSNKLIAGLHRIEAYKLLGWDKIKAKVYDKDKLYAELAEIDENLMRNELHPIERGEVFIKRKGIYEELFPQAKAGVKGAIASNIKQGKGKFDATETVSVAFTTDTAKKTGFTERTIRHDIQLATDLDKDVKDKIIESGIDKKTALRIARKNKTDQKKIIKLSEKTNVETAIKKVEKDKRIAEVKSVQPEEKTDLEILDELKIDIQLYNIWNFGKRDLGFGKEIFGNQPAELIFNLLYYYTNQKDLIWDVFAGGGVVHDVCKKFNRECYSTDLSPVRKEIEQMNILKKLPDIEPQFLFLDPPYWLQAKGQYSDSPEDFGNMSLDRFYDSFDDLFKRIAKKFKKYTLALLIANTQYPNEDKHVEPHAFKLYEMLDEYFKFEHHIIVPYSTQQYNGTMVEVAKKNKLILNLHRDLLIFKK